MKVKGLRLVEWFIGKWLDLNGAVASLISLIWYHKPLTVNQRYTSVLVDINIYEYCESEWTDTSTFADSLELNLIKLKINKIINKVKPVKNSIKIIPKTILNHHHSKSS